MPLGAAAVAAGLLAGCTLGPPHGCLRGCAAGARTQGPLRVLTLNMAQGTPDFEPRTTRLDLVAGEMRRLDPDVSVLVEISWTPGLGNGAAYLARRTGSNHVFARSAGNRRAILFEEGVAILSRFPLRDTAVFVLATPSLGLGRRIALRATVETPWGDVLVFAAHLEPYDPPRNARQMRALAALVDRHEGLAIVAGDLNAPDDAPQIRALLPAWIDTYRAANPGDAGVTCCVADLQTRDRMRVEGRLDYIFLRPAPGRTPAVRSSRRVLTAPVPRRSGWLWASDHFAVLSEVEL